MHEFQTSTGVAASNFSGIVTTGCYRWRHERIRRHCGAIQLPGLHYRTGTEQRHPRNPGSRSSRTVSLQQATLAICRRNRHRRASGDCREGLSERNPDEVGIECSRLLRPWHDTLNANAQGGAANLRGRLPVDRCRHRGGAHGAAGNGARTGNMLDRLDPTT